MSKKEVANQKKAAKEAANKLRFGTDWDDNGDEAEEGRGYK